MGCRAGLLGSTGYMQTYYSLLIIYHGVELMLLWVMLDLKLQSLTRHFCNLNSIHCGHQFTWYLKQSSERHGPAKPTTSHAVPSGHSMPGLYTYISCTRITHYEPFYHNFHAEFFILSLVIKRQHFTFFIFNIMN